MPAVDTSDVPSAFAGSTAVVTGASGGIGRAVAVKLAQAGIDAVGIHFANRQSEAERTAGEVVRLGSRAELFQADFADTHECRRLVNETFERLSPSIWIHAAGADVLTGQAASEGFEQKLARLVNVDLIGTITVARHVARRMLESAGSQSAEYPAGSPEHSLGSIVLIGWDQASEGMEGDAGQMFGPVKAGVEAFARSLAQEVAPRVRVNTVAPGWIRTAWGENADSYWDRRARSQALVGRWGHPEDVAAAALFLAGRAGDFITGQTLAVNGGFNRRWPQS